MRAILPGRPQSKRQALCTAHWDGLRLIAYLSGNTAIILSGPRDILQTIRIDNAKSLTAITIEESSGRIAVCDGHRVYVYNAIGRDEDDLRWSHNHEIEVQETETINSISWGSEEELLLGGSMLWLHHLPRLERPHLVWEQAIANNVSIVSFSNDAELTATCGEHDRLVKIWRRLSHELDSTRFDVSYLPHPATVTDMHWRKPWHAEQNLDSLLYTICSDNQVRLWTYSDPHSISVMQLIATIDTNASIQPRRLSVGSMSSQRYIFILDSRDFSQATERALQSSKQKQVDHALEHLVEVANRSPEICVVFDGIGHMSAWGLENAGCKSRKPTVVFNVALVDNVKMQLQFQQKLEDNYIRLCAFAGAGNSSSLVILVHSYTGQVDWYESPVTTFFDTSARENRVSLASSWSGHDLTIDHIARGTSGLQIITWTDEGQAILWSQTLSGALRRRCEVTTAPQVISMLLLDKEGLLIVLHAQIMTCWRLRGDRAVEINSVKLQPNMYPTKLGFVPSGNDEEDQIYFILCAQEPAFELWHVDFRAGKKGLLERVSKTSKLSNTKAGSKSVVPCDVIFNGVRAIRTTNFPIVTVDETGLIQALASGDLTTDRSSEGSATLVTNVENPDLLRVTTDGHIAMTSKDGRSLLVWSLHQNACEWNHIFDEQEPIQKLAWTSTLHGQPLLFVSFSYHALVIGPARFALDDESESWHILQNISLRDFTTSYIGDISWLSSGDIAIGAGNQLFVLESACSMSDRSGNDLLTGRSQTEKVANIVDYENSVLPVFHPSYLQELAYQGHYQRIKEVLFVLYEKLKYFSDGDQLDSFLELDITTRLTDGNQEIDDLSSKDSADSSLEDVQAVFNDYVKSSDISQLSSQDKSLLSEFLLSFVTTDKHRMSLDENALRYLYAFYSTPAGEDLPWSSFVFAQQSTSQQALLELVLRQYESKITWAVARRTGLFIWLADLTTLREQFENVARAEYTKNEDRNPIDCSLHYLALNKKSVLQGLWRRTIGVKEKDNTMKLLANNFDDPKWKATALKNAYALLSRRRFEYAAAFFLLGGGLKDAANVCINQLNDVQLAIAITRVWDKDREQSERVLQDLLQKTVLSRAMHEKEGRWIASWAYLELDSPREAVQVIVRPVHQVVTDTNLKDHEGPTKSMFYTANDPRLCILYVQLRDKLIKQRKWTKDVLAQSEERDFVMRAVGWYVRAGLDLVALDVVRHWKFLPHQSSHANVSVPSVPTVQQEDAGRSSKTTEQTPKKKPAPTQFVEPSANSLLDSFGF